MIDGMRCLPGTKPIRKGAIAVLFVEKDRNWRVVEGKRASRSVLSIA
jgi:hypothetical protein